MSSNFGEIIKKLYFLVARQRATHAIPDLSASRYRTLHMVDGKCEPQVRDLLAGIPRFGEGGRAG
jgi:hypothetical protein